MEKSDFVLIFFVIACCLSILFYLASGDAQGFREQKAINASLQSQLAVMDSTINVLRQKYTIQMDSEVLDRLKCIVRVDTKQNAPIISLEVKP